jgi:hypothetical protein
MVRPREIPADPQILKKALHEKIEQLDAGSLSLLNRVALQLEAEALAQDLDAGFDRDRQEGKLSPERMRRVLSEFRAEHGYR